MLFELVILSHTAHVLYPKYSLLNKQCYFYAGIIFTAIQERWGVCPSELPVVNVHQPSNVGCIKGMKVQIIDPEKVSSLISKYEDLHSLNIAAVF